MLQTAKALKFIHDKGYIYHDLKLDNIILLKGDIKKKNDVKVRIIDFDFLKEGPNAKEAYGTLYYMAPEVKKNEIHTNKCDIYSFGIMMLEIIKTIQGKHLRLYREDDIKIDMEDTLKQIFADINTYNKKNPQLKTDSLLSIADSCVKETPTDRLTADEIINQLEKI